MPQHDPHTRLQQLRFLERVQLGDLERTRRWIAEEEARVKETERRRETLEREVPDWILQTYINSGERQKRMVHSGECFVGVGKRTQGISRDQAVQALAEGAEPCNVCKPDALLRLDP